MTKLRAEAERLFRLFQNAGAIPVEADILQPAETLLDLYGEDIRARAYVTHDPLRGEMMLRPDFTVPVVQAHMAHGADPARYCYMGEVFRKQDHLNARPSEYLQVGFELFDRADTADAEVFALFSNILADQNLTPITGDIGILMAAVRGLTTSEVRKSALLRHIWRPKRFRALLDRFSGRAAVPPARATLLGQLSKGDLAAQIEQAGQFIGLRSAEDIMSRAESLLADASSPVIPAPEAVVIYDLLSLQATSDAALTHWRGITALLPAIEPAIERFSARLTDLRALGIDTAHLAFEASFGRTSMEYYDGFVFGFQGDMGAPPVASGGRYDALTARLGAGRSIPAVGGVIRPNLMRGGLC
jgi:ATP phosphoribosyltransferase regulatory subunit